MRTGHDHTWLVLTQKIIEKEFALSGSEQNPDITGKSVRELLKARIGSGAPAPVEAFKRHGADFVVERDLRALVDGMNRLTDSPLLNFAQVEAEVVARDREMDNPYTKDAQITAIHGARRYLPDRITRIAAPHSLLDPDAGPLIGVKLHILTRKTLGGLLTDLDGRVLRAGGDPLPGLYAAGEVAGFGGGGMHGYRALEGTFLGGCCSQAAPRAARSRARSPERRQGWWTTRSIARATSAGWSSAMRWWLRRATISSPCGLRPASSRCMRPQARSSAGSGSPPGSNEIPCLRSGCRESTSTTAATSSGRRLAYSCAT
jgi:hypothetical protein